MKSAKLSHAKDPQLLLRRIRSSFPDIQWNTYRYIDEGWDHEVIILDEKIVFRFPNDEQYLHLLHSEVEVLRQLKPLTAVTIPDYTYVASDYSFAGYALVDGKPLRKARFDKLAPDERAKVARQLAAFLSAIHTLTWQADDPISSLPSDMKDEQALTRQRTDRYLKEALSAEDFAIAQSILAETDKLLREELPLVLLHGDIYHEHLLWDVESQRLGIIDFSDMSRGDPAFDFAELYEYGADFIAEVYGCYTGPKDDTFLKRAWTYQQWVGVYMMTDHFVYHKTSFEVAKETFEYVKQQQNHPTASGPSVI